MEEPIRVAAGVLRKDSEVLVCRRRADQDHGGKWEFPGGKLEPGETPEQCLRRELDEELGIRVDGLAPLRTITHRYEGRRAVELHFFNVASIVGEPRNRVFAEIRWVATLDLAALDFLAADLPIVEALASGDL